MPGSDGNEANGNKQFIIQPIFFCSAFYLLSIEFRVLQIAGSTFQWFR